MAVLKAKRDSVSRGLAPEKRSGPILVAGFQVRAAHDPRISDRLDESRGSKPRQSGAERLPSVGRTDADGAEGTQVQSERGRPILPRNPSAASQNRTEVKVGEIHLTPFRAIILRQVIVENRITVYTYDVVCRLYPSVLYTYIRDDCIL